MSPRVEPTLEPRPRAPETQPTHITPEETRLPKPSRKKSRRRPGFSPTLWLWGVVLGLVALIFLVLLALRWLPPPTTSYMLQSPTQPVHQQWVPAAQIAEAARRAVVASEDQKFWSHEGFDVEAIEKAYEQNQRKGRHRIRGASTISQQTVKNLFLWPGGGYFRKGIEAALTVAIEELWGKPRILEMYLNIVEFGPGVYGIEAAAQTYFNKPAARLAPAEAARLAAVLPSPRHWNARAPGPYVQARTAWILGQMGYGARREEPEPAADDLSLPSSDRDDGDATPGEATPAAAPSIELPSPEEK